MIQYKPLMLQVAFPIKNKVDFQNIDWMYGIPNKVQLQNFFLATVNNLRLLQIKLNFQYYLANHPFMYFK